MALPAVGAYSSLLAEDAAWQLKDEGNDVCDDDSSCANSHKLSGSGRPVFPIEAPGSVRTSVLK